MSHATLHLPPPEAVTHYRNHFAKVQQEGFRGDYVHFLEAMLYRAFELVEAMKEANGPQP
jgi:hypothetical protein